MLKEIINAPTILVYFFFPREGANIQNIGQMHFIFVAVLCLLERK